MGHILSSPWAEKAELFPPAPTLRWKPNLGWYVLDGHSESGGHSVAIFCQKESCYGHGLRAGEVHEAYESEATYTYT